MGKYRKKPVEIEATQWHKNGDHPQDECETFDAGDGPFQGEGKVVRYYRTPDLDGQNECEYCNEIMHVHGWIDTVQGGHIVCPGDWIINESGEIKEGFYPCKPDIFEVSYEKVEENINV